MNDLALDLRQFIDENFLFGMVIDYTDEDSFLENSIIDSTGVLELIAHLEGKFGITIEDEDLVPENLDSISCLTRFLTRKCDVEQTASVQQATD